MTSDGLADDASKVFDTGIWVHKASETDYQALKPHFGYLSVETAEKTFKNSNQHGCVFNSNEGNQFKRCKSPQPAMNITRWNKDIPIDEMFSGVPPINGRFKNAMVFFGCKSHVIHVEEMTRSKRLLQCLQNLTTKCGAPSRIAADHAGYHESYKVLSCLRMLWIRLRFSEACCHHQNSFERKHSKDLSTDWWIKPMYHLICGSCAWPAHVSY